MKSSKLKSRKLPHLITSLKKWLILGLSINSWLRQRRRKWTTRSKVMQRRFRNLKLFVNKRIKKCYFAAKRMKRKSKIAQGSSKWRRANLHMFRKSSCPTSTSLLMRTKSWSGRLNSEISRHQSSKLRSISLKSSYSKQPMKTANYWCLATPKQKLCISTRSRWSL